jgi:hypothetical protein
MYRYLLDGIPRRGSRGKNRGPGNFGYRKSPEFQKTFFQRPEGVKTPAHFFIVSTGGYMILFEGMEKTAADSPEVPAGAHVLNVAAGPVSPADQGDRSGPLGVGYVEIPAPVGEIGPPPFFPDQGNLCYFPAGEQTQDTPGFGA